MKLEDIKNLSKKQVRKGASNKVRGVRVHDSDKRRLSRAKQKQNLRKEDGL